MTRVALFGATGAVGGAIAREAAKARLDFLVAFTRRTIDFKDLLNDPDDIEWCQKHWEISVINFDHVEDELKKYANRGLTHCVSALGTTRAQAGSAEAFRKIDYELNLSIAKGASESIPHFHLISSANANANSWFPYLKVKGQLEKEVRALTFESVHIYHPSLLLTPPRRDTRPAESVAQTVSRYIDFNNFWSISVETVAKSVVNRIIHPPPDVEVLNVSDMLKIQNDK